MRLLRHIFLVTVTLIIVISTMFFLVIPIIVNAQVSFSVYPEKFDLELAPGEIYQHKIRVLNSSQNDLLIGIQIKNFSATGERGKMSFFEGNNDISFDARQWIKFEEESFLLKKQAFKEINFSIHVPENAESGGYYLTVFFQGEVSSRTDEKPVKIITNVGSLFLLKIKGGEGKYPSLNKQFELVEFNSPGFVENGPMNLNFRLKNNDPVHIRVGGKLIIYDFFSKIKEEIVIADQTILPGKIRVFELQTSDQKFFDKFFIGPYRAELILSTATWREKIGNDQQVVSEINFWAFPWRPFLILIMIILIIVLLMIIFKRKKNKYEKLFRQKQ